MSYKNTLIHDIEWAAHVGLGILSCYCQPQAVCFSTPLCTFNQTQRHV